MIVARRDMTLNNQPVVAGQVLDSIWPDLRELARRNLLRARWVEEVHTDTAVVEAAVTVETQPKRKRGRPKGSKNKPKPAAQAKV